MSARPAELRALTGARGVAAWLVVLYHIRLSIAGLPQPVVAALGKGYLAVDFFFLLSGFVIWLAWHERLRDGGRPAMAAFLRRRVARIWPLHLLLLGAATVLALALLASGHPDAREYPFAQLPLQAVLMQNWGFTDALAWNEPAWSISAELAAYLLFAPLARVMAWDGWRTWALVAVAAILLLTLDVAMADQRLLSQQIPRFGLLRCLAEFGTGTILAALWRRAPGARWTGPGIVAAALLLLRALDLRETLVVPAMLAAALLALARGAGARRNPLEGRIVHYLGEISFATYLSHMLIWRVFKMALVADPLAVPPMLVLLYLGTVALASVALYELVERPAQRWVQALRPGARPARRRADRRDVAEGRPAPLR